MDFTILTNAGIDVEDANKRFSGNAALFGKMLQKFLADQSYNKLLEALGNNSPKDVLAASHTLKGLCGMLSFTRLHALFTEQVSLLRADEYEKAIGMMSEISMNYEKITGAIREWLGDTELNLQ